MAEADPVPKDRGQWMPKSCRHFLPYAPPAGELHSIQVALLSEPVLHQGQLGCRLIAEVYLDTNIRSFSIIHFQRMPRDGVNPCLGLPSEHPSLDLPAFPWPAEETAIRTERTACRLLEILCMSDASQVGQPSIDASGFFSRDAASFL